MILSHRDTTVTPLGVLICVRRIMIKYFTVARVLYSSIIVSRIPVTRDLVGVNILYTKNTYTPIDTTISTHIGMHP